MVASEAAPFAKTGGLADVIGALPAALQRHGDQVAVVMPRYGRIPTSGLARVYEDLDIWLGLARHTTTVFHTLEGGVPFYFIDCPPLYSRPELYGENNLDYPDNLVRFAVLSRAALEVARRIWRPQVIHCHDWQSALVPISMRHFFCLDPTFVGLKTLFTIHNLGYQGIFPKTGLIEAGLDDGLFKPELLEFFGKINLLKGALVSSDAISTVSKGYAREIQEPELGFGLDDLLRARSDSLYGILNGVDYDQWSPETDRYIAAHYTADDPSGKAVCKRDLLASVGLPEQHRPVLGMISRMVPQKGFDILTEVAGEIAELDIAWVLLGSGEPAYESVFQDLSARYPDRIAACIGYDEALAHKIEAGADIFLMPSHYEPCGLNQIYSLKYGTIPVVRATGGLDDTIKEGTGFKFSEYSGRALLDTLRTALDAYRDKTEWAARMRRSMEKDFSWDASAAEYSALYRRLAG